MPEEAGRADEPATLQKKRQTRTGHPECGRIVDVVPMWTGRSGGSNAGLSHDTLKQCQLIHVSQQGQQRCRAANVRDSKCRPQTEGENLRLRTLLLSVVEERTAF